MKTIYVTVAEFLENGGELTSGRVIFRHITGQQEGIYCGVFKHNSDLITIFESPFPFHKEACYVQVQCNPIYK